MTFARFHKAQSGHMRKVDHQAFVLCESIEQNLPVDFFRVLVLFSTDGVNALAGVLFIVRKHFFGTGAPENR